MTTDDAFEALYEAHYEDLLRYAVRRVEQPVDAADIVSETWTIAWRRRSDLPPPAEQRLWLFGVARRVLANHRRGRLRQTRLSDRLRTELQQVPAMTPAADDRVTQALRRLSQRDREVLFLSAWEDLSPEDIGKVLGCTAASARVRLHRARTRLRAALDEAAPTPKPGHAAMLIVEESR